MFYLCVHVLFVCIQPTSSCLIILSIIIIFIVRLQRKAANTSKTSKCKIQLVVFVMRMNTPIELGWIESNTATNTQYLQWRIAYLYDITSSWISTTVSSLGEDVQVNRGVFWCSFLFHWHYFPHCTTTDGLLQGAASGRYILGCSKWIGSPKARPNWKSIQVQ